MLRDLWTQPVHTSTSQVVRQPQRLGLPQVKGAATPPGERGGRGQSCRERRADPSQLCLLHPLLAPRRVWVTGAVHSSTSNPPALWQHPQTPRVGWSCSSAGGQNVAPASGMLCGGGTPEAVSPRTPQSRREVPQGRKGTGLASEFGVRLGAKARRGAHLRALPRHPPAAPHPGADEPLAGGRLFPADLHGRCRPAERFCRPQPRLGAPPPPPERLHLPPPRAKRPPVPSFPMKKRRSLRIA